MSRIVFDIGATHMRIAELNGEGIGAVADAPTPKLPEAAIEEFARIARRIVPIPEGAIGGVPSIVTNGVMSGATNLPAWEGFDFGSALHARLSAPVIVRNDAELCGLGEAVYGAGKGYRTVAYLGVGSGVGTARIIDGVIEEHSSEGPARLSIIALSDGQTLEQRIGGISLTHRYGHAPAALSRTVWDELTRYLLEGIANAKRVWEPDLVVLGGSLMSEADGFRMNDIIGMLPMNSPAVRKGTLGNTAGLYGARALGDSL
jgi:glucokinase